MLSLHTVFVKSLGFTKADVETNNSAYVNRARIRSWNQPVLSNEGKVRGRCLPIVYLSVQGYTYTIRTDYTSIHFILTVL